MRNPQFSIRRRASRHLRLRARTSFICSALAVTTAFVAAPASAQTQRPSTTQTIDSAEYAATIHALRPPKRARPVVAVLANAVGTETTDYLVPYGVLRRSAVADVWAVSTVDGPVTLHPALVIRPQATVASFDLRYPDGADYVIVPAMHNEHDPAVLEWITLQRAKGATIVGVCSGARVLSNAGLLRGRAATGHWYDISRLQKQNPDMHYVRDRRYVAESGIVTTTGVSASLPIALALVEAIAGRDSATVVALSLGVTDWGPEHVSAAFQRRFFMYAAIALNASQFWRREQIGVPVADGVDEVALAFTADAWSRTYRSRALAVRDVAANADAIAQANEITTLGGLVLIADGPDMTGLRMVALRNVQPAAALDTALAHIGERYGARTARLVALQLEYPRPH